jgi:hypothetical protein
MAPNKTSARRAGGAKGLGELTRDGTRKIAADERNTLVGF